MLFSNNKNNQSPPSLAGEQSRRLDTKPVNQAPDNSPLSKKVTDPPLGPLDTNSLKKIKKKPYDPPIKQKTIPETSAPLTVEVPTSDRSKIKNSAKGEKEVITVKPSKQTLLPLENNSLKVQAISWEQSQSNRIAVIDNSVLREGDFVQSYRLVRNEKDSVILNYSGSEYRLGFRYR